MAAARLDSKDRDAVRVTAAERWRVIAVDFARLTQAMMGDGAYQADRVRGCDSRDRAGLSRALRRAEIAALTVGDLHQNGGYDSLRDAQGRSPRRAGDQPADHRAIA